VAKRNLIEQMPQTRYERLPGESEVDFSARMAEIQSEAMQERKRDADIASQAGYEEAAYSDSPLAKFKRVWES
jgi:hypothetical protein